VLLTLAFGVMLMAAVLLSGHAQRTVLSSAVLFLIAGFLLGRGGLGWTSLAASDELIGSFAELALFTILFLDGTQLPLKKLTQAWRLPGRALLVGMPLTLGGIALAAHLLLGLGWANSFLLGAVLSPTDPVFVAALLEHEHVPIRLRRLLSVESGLNDGIALPAVMVLLALSSHTEVHILRVVLEAGLGVLVGVVVPAAFLWLAAKEFLPVTSAYRPLGGVAIACVLFGGALLSGANVFLAAFAGGVTIASMRPAFAGELRSLAAPVAEALKLATVLVFGTTLSFPLLLSEGARGLGFAVLALLAVRPAAIVLSFLGGGLSRKEWLAAAWFGPRGFSSLLYALMMLHAGLPNGSRLFAVAALVIVLSIVAHSSTDVAVARTFHEEEQEPQEPQEQPDG
jgi:sodium/hydrogen antiporter